MIVVVCITAVSIGVFFFMQHRQVKIRFPTNESENESENKSENVSLHACDSPDPARLIHSRVFFLPKFLQLLYTKMVHDSFLFLTLPS